ncbi:hypothetical protein OCK74_15920 [Chitinophagaceae bacterium LB-8]|uniref:Uncharacterized protein n=1 Tax=Paraflavisolibacter caeni TaxID=2982496 RepID=A0A9X2XXX9_9BACT|nr:hypothetical protein [Paraflavisolibacter caeni]MCU7550607.1 hypothetical protein [Paraflavisolibacter caeni]
MTIHDFKILDDHQKATALVDEGVLIGKRDLLFYLVFLYQVEGFYVEVLYSIKSKKVHKFRAFENVGLLDPYLSKIDISELHVSQ